MWLFAAAHIIQPWRGAAPVLDAFQPGSSLISAYWPSGGDSVWQAVQDLQCTRLLVQPCSSHTSAHQPLGIYPLVVCVPLPTARDRPVRHASPAQPSATGLLHAACCVVSVRLHGRRGRSPLRRRAIDVVAALIESFAWRYKILRGVSIGHEAPPRAVVLRGATNRLIIVES